MNRLLRRSEVESLTSLSKARIYVEMSRGKFPRPRRTGLRSVAWREQDVEQWIAEQPEADPLDVKAPGRAPVSQDSLDDR